MTSENRSLLLEVGCAEMPAAYIPEMMRQLGEWASREMDRARLDYGSLVVWGTPRRLVLMAHEVAAFGRSSVEEVRGPSVEIAFDEAGQPSRAAEGFARGQGVSVEELVIREDAKGRYVYAVKEQEGATAEDLLGHVLPATLQALHPPRIMRWGVGDMAFLRPVHWLVALWGETVIPVSFGGQQASRESQGPRYAPGSVVIRSAETYQAQMKELGVLVDHQERRTRILQLLESAATEVESRAVISDSLLDEVTYLIEYPAVVIGRIPEEYLAVPRIVLETSMTSQLRFFPVEGDRGQLRSYFLSVINGTSDMVNHVRPGNELVLNAKLADARFFWDEDRKQSLETYAEALKDVVFHEDLGSLADKASRLQATIVELVKSDTLPDELRVPLHRAAWLCKADLVTLMVGEFPMLQGLMGAEYGRLSGESETVCEAIAEHYLPSGPDSKLPMTPAGRWLSLLDKSVHLVGGFSASLATSGSEDPYGLRRTAIGMLRLLRVMPGLSMKHLLSISAAQYQNAIPSHDALLLQIMEFVQPRLQNLLLDAGYSIEVVQGILAREVDTVSDVWLRAEAVTEFLKTDTADEYLVAWRRCENLGRKGQLDLSLSAADFAEPVEQALFEAFSNAREEGDQRLAQGEYLTFFGQLAALRQPVDMLLDTLMVMVDDADIREKRLALLRQVAHYLSIPMDWGALPG